MLLYKMLDKPNFWKIVKYRYINHYSKRGLKMELLKIKDLYVNAGEKEII